MNCGLYITPNSKPALLLLYPSRPYAVHRPTLMIQFHPAVAAASLSTLASSVDEPSSAPSCCDSDFTNELNAQAQS